MNYTINSSVDGHYIIHTIKGEINRKTAIQQILAAQSLGRKLGINRYLVDVTEARNTDSTINIYDLAYNDLRKIKGIDRLAHIALLVSPGDRSHNFYETVARNTGLNVKVFNDLELAKLFLTNQRDASGRSKLPC